MEVVLIFSVTYLIMIIVGSIVTYNTKEKDIDKVIALISFLIPLIGLIIYAVNVGKDEKIVKSSLYGVKRFGIAFVMWIVVSVAVTLFILMFGYSTSKTVTVSSK